MKPATTALALALSTLALAGAAAAAPTKKECAAVRGDCARWLQEIEASQPTGERGAGRRRSLEGCPG